MSENLSLIDEVDRDLKKDGYPVVMEAKLATAALGIGKRTLRRYIQRGLIRPLPCSGLRHKYRRRDIAAFFARRPARPRGDNFKGRRHGQLQQVSATPLP